MIEQQKSNMGKSENQEKNQWTSTTKIMTSIVVLENANLKDTVTISKNRQIRGALASK